MRSIWQSTFRVFVCACVLALLFFPGQTVSAHANLVRSTPENGAVLQTSPESIVIEYSEALDLGFTKIELVNTQTQEVVSQDFSIDPAHPEVLHVKIQPLKTGVYSAQFRVRSAVDGHINIGAVNFSVGLAESPFSLLPPVGAPDPATTLPAWPDPLLRWLAYIGLALTTGSLWFAILVWKPAFRRGEGSPEDDRSLLDLVQRISGVGMILLGAASLGQVVYELIYLSGGAAEMTANLGFYFSSRSGLLLLLRLILIGLYYFVTRDLPPPGSGRTAPWLAVFGMGVALLATFTLQSHMAATGSPVDAVSAGIHLAAMSAWMGGLVPLVFLVSSRKGSSIPREILIPHFSRLGLVSVGLLGLSGLFDAWIQVRTLDALLSTTYGQAVVVKTGLFLLLILLGAVNLLVISPRLGKRGARQAGWLPKTVRGELILGGLVLVFAGILTSVNPARDALQAQRAQGYSGRAQVEGVRMTLRVAPVQIGENEFGIEFFDPRPSSVPTQVLLRLVPPEEELGVTQIVAKPTAGPRYDARGSYIPTGGKWGVEVILRRSGLEDIRHTFDLTIPGGDENGERSAGNPVPADNASIASGKALYAQECAACHGESGQGNGPLGLSLNPPPSNLTEHAVVGIHTDTQLFDWITFGYPNSAMPGFGDQLNEKERWDLVNYIRTLAGHMQ